MDPDPIPSEQRETLELTPAEIPDGVALVLVAIASLNGGSNGSNPDRVLGIEILDAVSARYTLTARDDPANVQSFVVTIREE